MTNVFDIQSIEQALSDALKTGKVAGKVFKGQRPNLKESSMPDFAVVSVVTGITDLRALGNCMCRIELFAKNLSNGEKNSTKLSLMYKSLTDILPIVHEKYIFDNHPAVIPLGSDDYGYNVIAIQLNTHIKTL